MISTLSLLESLTEFPHKRDSYIVPYKMPNKISRGEIVPKMLPRGENVPKTLAYGGECVKDAS